MEAVISQRTDIFTSLAFKRNS